MNNTENKQVSIMKQNYILKRKKNGDYRACLKYSVPTFVEQIYKMQRLEVSGAVRTTYGSLGFKRLIQFGLRIIGMLFVRLKAVVKVMP